MIPCFTTAGDHFAPVKPATFLLCLLTLATVSHPFAQTTYTTTPRTPRAIKHDNLGTWANFNADALKADDNNYMAYTFAPSWNGSDRLDCYDFDFSDIPDHATIIKMFLKVIRFKKGKPYVSDGIMFFSKTAGYQMLGPNLMKPDAWPTSEGAAYYEENGSSPGEVNNYSAYTYSVADVKNPTFSVRLSAYRNTTSPTTVYIEQVQVWIEYTVPDANTTTTAPQTSIQKDNTLELKQYNRSLYFKGLQEGRYQLTVTDLHGRLLQQSTLNNTGEQTVPLIDRCRGYCIISVEGNGKRKTLKAYVQ
jgi:hypothetical protein